MAEGRFGTHMEIELVNDGPVTLVLEFAPSRQVDRDLGIGTGMNASTKIASAHRRPASPAIERFGLVAHRWVTEPHREYDHAPHQPPRPEDAARESEGSHRREGRAAATAGDRVEQVAAVELRERQQVERGREQPTQAARANGCGLRMTDSGNRP